MRFSLYSRKDKKEYEFWAPDNGGYVYLESPGRPGTLGSQICEGGGFMGSTISCTGSSSHFEEECRRWYRAHRREDRLL